MAKIDAMKELGRIGQKRYGGYFQEEFLTELRGNKGIEVYREMSENDNIVGACLYAIETLLKQSSWDVKPASTSKIDVEAAEFIKSCLDDMNESWIDTLSEMLSFLSFGWSYHEIVYKRRLGQNTDHRLKSKHTDGLIGWRKLPIRAQETLWQWEYDDEDNLLGMSQLAPPNFHLATIPIEKALHIRTKSRKNNPEGKSILRNAYESWYYKRKIQEIEGIGAERDLAGYPVLTPPEGLNIWDTDDEDMVAYRLLAEEMVKSVRRDESEGLVKPFGWTFELLSSGGKRNFDTNQIIERHDTRIAQTMLADFILVGHQSTGSFALSSDKTAIFSLAIGGYLDTIAQAFNLQAIPRLIELNKEHFKGITDYPKLTHGDVETPNLQELGAFIKDMTGVGVLIPDGALETYVRQVADLPEKEEGTERPLPNQSPEDPNGAEDDEKAAEMAKNILKRVRG